MLFDYEALAHFRTKPFAPCDWNAEEGSVGGRPPTIIAGTAEFHWCVPLKVKFVKSNRHALNTAAPSSQPRLEGFANLF